MSVDEETLKRRYREFIDLLPLTTAIAGLPVNTTPRSFTQEQMEARAQVLVSAFKLARQCVREAIKNFCLLDGSFVIREDGVVLAAGRYLQSPRDLDIDLPLGLGTRNAAAMTVTKVSRAIAFVVSKTSGAVRVYKNGELALELKQSRRRLT